MRGDDKKEEISREAGSQRWERGCCTVYMYTVYCIPSNIASALTTSSFSCPLKHKPAPAAVLSSPASVLSSPAAVLSSPAAVLAFLSSSLILPSNHLVVELSSHQKEISRSLAHQQSFASLCLTQIWLLQNMVVCKLVANFCECIGN